jgi:Leucine-rich repeat (LRR) protein
MYQTAINVECCVCYNESNSKTQCCKQGLCKNCYRHVTKCPICRNIDSFKNERAFIRTLRITPQNIRELNRLKYYTSLETLNCSFCDLNELLELPPTLVVLNCSNNNLTGLKLPSSLRVLICNNNQLCRINMPAKLRVINCNSNFIREICELPSRLEVFDCGANFIKTFPPLPITLREFYCGNNLIDHLPPLPDSLETLDCSRNRITNRLNLTQTLQEQWNFRQMLIASQWKSSNADTDTITTQSMACFAD